MDKKQSEVKIIDCLENEHSAAILDLFNNTILHSTALYDYYPRQPDFMVKWFANKRDRGYPVLGAVNQTGQLLGFASWGAFRDYPANKYTVEHSIYIHQNYRRQGLAKRLMQVLIERAKEADVHVMVGCIDANNQGSIALHQQMGFQHVGTMPQIGFKFGDWLDVMLYQLILETPFEPQDD